MGTEALVTMLSQWVRHKHNHKRVWGNGMAAVGVGVGCNCSSPPGPPSKGLGQVRGWVSLWAMAMFVSPPPSPTFQQVTNTSGLGHGGRWLAVGCLHKGLAGAPGAKITHLHTQRPWGVCGASLNRIQRQQLVVNGRHLRPPPAHHTGTPPSSLINGGV